jgi:RNA polymerase sigma-70 factor (ECF subfamily)
MITRTGAAALRRSGSVRRRSGRPADKCAALARLYTDAMPGGDDDPGADVGRLYDRYGASLYRYALMILADPAAAEDALQHVFTGVLLKGRRIEQVERYLRRAVRNECYSALRWRSRSAGDAPLLELAAPDARPDDRMAIETAIRVLPAEQREVLHLHVFEGRTFHEIAELTGDSINTCASRYRYALTRLKGILIR